MIPTKDVLKKLARLDRRRGRQKIILYGAMGLLGVLLAIAQEPRWTTIHPAGWALGALVIICLVTFGIASAAQEPVRRLRDYFIQHRLFHDYCLSGAPYILILGFGDQASHLDKSLTGSGKPGLANARLNPADPKPSPLMLAEQADLQFGSPGTLLLYLSPIEHCETEDALEQSVFLIANRDDPRWPEAVRQLEASASLIIYLPEMSHGSLEENDQPAYQYPEKTAVYHPYPNTGQNRSVGDLKKGPVTSQSTRNESGSNLALSLKEDAITSLHSSRTGEALTYENLLKSIEKNKPSTEHVAHLFQWLLSEGLIRDSYNQLWQEKFGEEANKPIRRIAREIFELKSNGP